MTAPPVTMMTALPLIDCPTINDSRHRAHLVEHVTTDRAISDLEADWASLHARIKGAHPSTGSVWVLAWRDHLTHETGVVRAKLELFAVRNGNGDLIAVVPVVRHEAVVFGVSIARWLRVGIESQYTEPSRLLVAPEDELTVVRLLAERIVALKHEVVFWTGLRPDGRAMTCLLSETGAKEELSFSSLTVPLPRTWDALHARFSRNMRRTLVRNYRSLTSRNLDFSFRVVEEPSEVEEALDVFFALHRRSAEKRRALLRSRRFESQQTIAFLRTMTGRLANRGLVRIFALSIGDETVAMRIGFAYGGGIHLYLFTDDARWKSFGVLTITMSEIFKHAILNEYEFVYLSTGRCLSNLRWRPDETRSGHVAIWQRTPRARFLSMARVIRRTVVGSTIAVLNAWAGILPPTADRARR